MEWERIVREKGKKIKKNKMRHLKNVYLCVLQYCPENEHPPLWMSCVSGRRDNYLVF